MGRVALICASTMISFSTLSCARPLYRDGGLEVNSQPWNISSLPSIELLTPPSVPTNLNSGYLDGLMILTFGPMLSPLKEGNLSMDEGGGGREGELGLFFRMGNGGGTRGDSQCVGMLPVPSG